MDRRLGVVGPIVLNIGEILQKAIQINNLNPRENNISESYILAGMAKNKSNRPYIVSFVVNRYTSELVDMEVLYSVNAKKEPAGLSDPSVPANIADYFTDSDISITDFLDYVNNYYPDILPEGVLKHYGYTSIHFSFYLQICCLLRVNAGNKGHSDVKSSNFGNAVWFLLSVF